MTRTTIQRWTIATLGFIAIALIDVRFGHATALITLLVLMLLVAIYGGSGYGNKPHGARSGRPGTESASPDGSEGGAGTEQGRGSTAP
jgi:hypothetical protein